MLHFFTPARMVLAATLVASPTALPSAAQDAATLGGKTCYVSKFRFDNRGAYQVDSFKVSGYEYRGYASPGESRTLDLKHASVSAGSNVFLKYRLYQGDSYTTKSCQKSGTKLRYHPQGNTWTYRARGTTQNNNRCRFGNNTCLTLAGISTK